MLDNLQHEESVPVSLFESQCSLDDITIIVYSTDYALTFESFDKDKIKTPTAIFVSDSLQANKLAEKILYDCSYATGFKSIAGHQNGLILTQDNETVLSAIDTEKLYYRGFNPLRFMKGDFYIWRQNIFGALTENNEVIDNIPNYLAYRWAMKSKKFSEKATKFMSLAVADIIEIGDGYFTFSFKPVLYKTPKGLKMTSGNVISYKEDR